MDEVAKHFKDSRPDVLLQDGPGGKSYEFNFQPKLPDAIAGRTHY
jgi:hypothetical protein